MTDNIKVTAQYSIRPDSEFETYLEELRAMKAKNERNKAEKLPIINAIGKAKFDAIHEQLQPIVSGMISYMNIVGKNSLNIEVVSRERLFTIKYYNNKYYAYIGNCLRDFNKYNEFSSEQRYYLEHWNEFDFIEKLSAELKKLINISILSEERDINDVNKRLENIQK